jgi:uncharacterized protein YbbK (DUF523 family)
VSERPRVGISRCLLGDEVRYDGGHKLEASLVDLLGSQVEWVEVCPEVEVGMGVPREPIQLVTGGAGVSAGLQGVRLVGVQSGEDWTDRMQAWSSERVRQLAAMNLSGFVLKARSPSCGPRDVPIHPGSDSPGSSMTSGQGLFAQVLTQAFPDLPIDDEEKLRNPSVRQAFLYRVFAFHRRT